MTTAEAMAPVVAIGDVHGCAALLKAAIQPYVGSGAELILLGDLIDRSPEPGGDRKVIELVRELQDNPAAHDLAAVTVIRGNHEQMLLDALAEDTPGEANELWEWNGGDPAFLPVARDHQDWLRSLPLTAVRGDYLFVHAGVRPGLDLEDQQPDDLLWIRRPFLQKPHGLPYTVVHGHTFRSDYSITRLPHRIGIDTGAYISGTLTALLLPLEPSASDVRVIHSRTADQRPDLAGLVMPEKCCRLRLPSARAEHLGSEPAPGSQPTKGMHR